MFRAAALLLSSSLALLWVSTASAQSTPEELDPETGRKIQYEQRTILDIDDPLLLDGTLVGPQIQLTTEPRRRGFNPLIHLREHFNEEMKQSLDEVK